jgi:N-acetylneuraminic acid mutarotase
LWIFGGFGLVQKNTGSLNELWKYSTGKSLWTWMNGSSSPNTAGVYGTQGKPAAANTPGGRTQPFGTTDAAGNCWIFGGSGYDGTGTDGALDDCWRYDPINNQWTWIYGPNTIGHTPVYPPAPGNVKAGSDPGGRLAGGAWTDGAGNFWLMGGFSSATMDTARNDIWQLNFSPYLTSATQVGQWTWAGGSDNVNSPDSLAHPRSLPFDGFPGARSGSTYGMDGQGNIWIFGGYGYDATGNQGLLNDLWSYQPEYNFWQQLKGDTLVNQYGVYGTQGSSRVSYTPGSRYQQTSCMDRNYNIWVFGGNGYAAPSTSGNLNDLWELSTRGQAWTWLAGSDAAVSPSTPYTGSNFGTLGVEAPGNMPGFRTEASSAVDADGNFWLYGGMGDDGTGVPNSDLYELWKYDPKAKEWTWMDGDKQGDEEYSYNGISGNPGARHGAAMWSDAAGNLWLFGGHNIYRGYLSDLWEYSTTSKTWELIDLPPDPQFDKPVYGTLGKPAFRNWPGMRMSPTVTLDAAGNVWLYGGFGEDANGQTGVMGDLWKLTPTNSFTTGIWTWMGGDTTVSTGPVYGIAGSGNLGNRPGARQGSAVWIDHSGNFWLMGGSDFAGQYHNDMWKFTPLTPVSLPIEEVTLEGRAEGSANSLTWQTIDELNTAGFEVERSTDGSTFSDIGSVTAVGSGNNSYSFIDSPLPPSARYFYRLKMSDKDGVVNYSQIIELYAPAASALSVYPNPTHGSVFLQQTDNSLLSTLATLLSIDGRLVRQYMITSQQQQLDLTGLSSGVYLLRLANGTAVKLLKE